MTLLGEYLEAFAATPTTAASQSGMVKKPVSTLQAVLHALGLPKTKANSDGLFGPTLQRQWAAEAQKRKLNPGIDRASKNEAWVVPATFNVLAGLQTKTQATTSPMPAPQRADWQKRLDNVQQAQQPAPSPAPAPGPSGGRYIPFTVIPQAKPTAAQGTVQPLLTLQRLLRGVGWRERSVPTDGKDFEATKKAWQDSAATRKLSNLFEPAGAGNASVDPVMLARMKKDVADAAAKKKAALPSPARVPIPKETEKKLAPAPAPANTVVKSVAVLQGLLVGLGYAKSKAMTDGLFGPTTTKAWQTEAQKRNVPTTFTRIDGKNARVSSAAYDRILADVQARSRAPRPMPSPSPAPAGPTAKPLPAPAGLVAYSVAELQKILIALGNKSKALTDGLFGPTSQKTWAAEAKKRKLDGTFARVDGKTARVSGETYVKLKAAAAGSKTSSPTTDTSKPAPTSSTLMITIKLLQQGLNGKGVKPLLDDDGIWGDRTQNALNAWLKSQAGGTNAKYTVSGKSVKMPALYAQSLEAAAKTAPRAPERVSISVADVKAGLKKLGRAVGAGALLDKITKAALESFVQEVDHGVNTGFKMSADQKTVTRIRKNVADKLLDAVKGAGGTTSTTTSASTGFTSYPIAQLQSILHKLGLAKTKATTDGLFGPTTQKAWQAQAQKRDLDKTFTRVDGKTAKVASATYASLYSAATGKPSAPSGDAPSSSGGTSTTPTGSTPTTPAPSPQDPVQLAAAAVAKQATVPTLVLTVQQALVATAKYPEVKPTGIWDDATQGGFISAIGVADTYKPVWLAAIPLLLSANQRTIRLLPAQAQNFGAAAKIYQDRLAQARAQAEAEEAARAQSGQSPLAPPEPPEPSPTSGPGPAPAPEPMPPQDLFPSPLPGPASEPAPAPAPEMEPVPQTSPAVANAGVQTWDTLVGSLQKFTALAPQYVEAYERAAQSPAGVNPAVKALFEQWVQSAERLKQRTAQLIEQSPEIRTSVDASATSVGFAGLYNFGGGYRRYFEGLEAAADTAIELLRKPAVVIAEPAPTGVQGFAGLGQLQVALGMLWEKLVTLLGTRAVATVAGVYIGTQGLNDVINKDIQTFEDLSEQVAQLVAEGKLSAEEGAQIIEAGKPKKSDWVGPVVLGATLLGGLAVWLNYEQGKKRSGGTHHAKRNG